MVMDKISLWWLLLFQLIITDFSLVTNQLNHYELITSVGGISDNKQFLQYKYDLISLMDKVQALDRFNYILIISKGFKNARRRDSCILLEILPHLHLPVILLNDISEMENLHYKHNNRVLIFYCDLIQNKRMKSRRKLTNILQLTQHVFIIDNEIPTNSYHRNDSNKQNNEDNEGLIIEQERRKLLNICYKLRDLELYYNWIIMRRSFVRWKILYTCGEPNTPNDFYRTITLMDNSSSSLSSSSTLTGAVDDTISIDAILDTKKLSNLNGLEIMIQPDQLPPRSMVYYDRFSGQLEIDGYVANIFNTFAQRRNATLHIKYPINGLEMIASEVLNEWSKAGILDAGITLISDIESNDDYDRLSYPVEIMDICFMAPLPQNMPINEIFTSVVQVHITMILILITFAFGFLLTYSHYKSCRQITLINILLNDQSIRGFLGMSFVTPTVTNDVWRCMCLLLCLSGMLVGTTYQAFLKAFLIFPPHGRRMYTFDDIRQAKYKIIVSEDDQQMADDAVWEANRDLFVLLNDTDEYLELRSSLDTNYVFSVTNFRWAVFKEQQNHFRDPIFHYMPWACLRKGQPLSIPLRPGLPYRHLLNEHIMQCYEVGVLQHWIKRSFYTMVKLGLITLKDLSPILKVGGAIEVIELQWMFALYLLCIGLAFFCLLIEILFHRYSLRVNS